MCDSICEKKCMWNLTFCVRRNVYCSHKKKIMNSVVNICSEIFTLSKHKHFFSPFILRIYCLISSFIILMNTH